MAPLERSIVQPYEHLVRMLSALEASVRSSQPAGAHAEQWSRAAASLSQELVRLSSFAAHPQGGSSVAQPDPGYKDAALHELAMRLTQLARTQDGLRIEHSAGVPAGQLLDERRLVVFAAWQLMQVLEQQAAAPTMGGR